MTLLIMVVSILILLVLTMPIAFSMGVGSLIAFLVDGTIGMTIIPQRMFAALNSWPIMAIPLFMLAGLLMEKGGITETLVHFANALIGFVKGSIAMVAVVASMLFSGISGSSTANVAATGSMTIPAMKKQGYEPAFAAAVEATASAIGPIIPPSILMIMIGFITETSIARLFLGGILPGLLVGGGMMLIVNRHAKKGGEAYLPTYTFSMKNIFVTAKDAIPGLILPLIIIFGIIFGIFTATEAAGVAVIYGLLVALFYYRKIKIRDLPGIFFEAAILSSAVMFIVTTAYIFGWLITVYQVPQMLSSYLQQHIENPVFFLLILNVTFLLVGMFLESFTAIIVFVPILFPIAINYGIDPIHFGIIVCVNLAVGYITPPYGATLYVASGIAGVSIRKVTPAILPMVVMMVAVLILVTYFPQAFMFIPNLLDLMN
jgi:C4-dicarboxylate transporter, DctM subunit